VEESTSEMGAKVTVVIAVFDPGEVIAPCIESLLGQTMPPGDLEVIFVDDGSTDATPAMLDRLADEHEHVHVVHQENSGWPGKPRNVGLDTASGDFVMFMDQDDALGVEAMQRMYDAGARNQADMVIGKVTSDFRPVPHFVWRNSIEKCTIRDHDLIHSLTPHKMFRREFLVDSGIRFPEGKRRLEDQLFMVRSYLAARCVSIVADYPCYFYLKRGDGRNSASALPDPRSYYGYLREILDVIDETVEAGAFRDSLRRRFYRGEMLGRLGYGRLSAGDPDYRADLFAEIRRLALERFPDTVPAGLEAQHRVRAALVREGRLDDLVDFAGRVQQVTATATVEHVQWRDGVLHADVDAGLVLPDGSPVQLVRRDGRYVLDPRLVDGLVPDEVAEADAAGVTAEVIVYNRDSAVEWFVPAQVQVVPPADADAPATIQVRAHLSIDPLAAAGGAALKPGVWAFMLRVRGCGFVRRTALRPVDAVAWHREALPALLGSPAITVAPRFGRVRAYAVLDVDEGRRAFGKGMNKRLRQGPTVDLDGVLTAVLPAVTWPGTAALPIVVELRASEDSPSLLVVDGWLQPEGRDVLLRAQLPSSLSGRLPRGATQLLVLWRLASSHRPPVRLGHISWPRKRFTVLRDKIPYRRVT
jgi:poly(ribitol-phosphate) beta-N-acetylglucosaminyltransferase